MLDHIRAKTFHARSGGIKNSFWYRVDLVLTDFGEFTPHVVSHNRFNLWSLWDKNHGGERNFGHGKEWFENILEQRGFPTKETEILLLAQPKFLWFQFNPVSFWIALKQGKPCAIVAEVNNTFGDRHCYFCALDKFKPITKNTKIIAEKLMHVSPFQRVEGQYHFNFDINDDDINIRIHYKNGDQGVLATLVGKRKPATNRSLIQSAITRPLGAVRVLTLIYWQALILYIKRAPFRRTPAPPKNLMSDSYNFRKPDNERP
ncbi:cyclopropane-fatty-acyl-phospholipid synthase [Amylibacter kogurei]|uniref:Cyclopropane-fatty-acyl-phospholipid synthase n=1 Tax=Paramylibacter kogurei TaxID=1889778 RepID=A0A2G5K9P9_9RHOB|nr:DUF1365 domain-containing protein [Amylibacter kogurei]PIB25610.1 cyclopropane-fatty-acyl-phospholipid synthase [Amylibacter kogurei]